MLSFTYLLLCFVRCTNCSLYDFYSYDFIVIGSGTGGVVASRLAEQKHKVLLIEAGPNDLTYSCAYNNATCIASPFGGLMAGTPLLPFKSNWWYSGVDAFRWKDAVSMPSYWNYNKTYLNFTENLSRARMLGGCLSHNSQVWIRGSVRDFDYVSWKYKLPDWSFENVLPYFQRSERYFGENKTLRGADGPIHLMPRKIHKWQYPMNALFNAAIQSGLEYNNHQNGHFSQVGIGFIESNIAKYENDTFGLFNTTHYRSSSAQSYIRDIGIRSVYLTVWYNTTVQRILFDDNKNAVGVEYYDPNNSFNLNSIYCSKEVILSAGTYQSPQLLMLSGIGPSEELNKFNITAVYTNNHIGRYGQNHPYGVYRTSLNMSYYDNMAHERPTKHTIWNTLLNTREYFDIPGGLIMFLSSGKYDRLGLDYADIRLLQMQTSGPDNGRFAVYMDPAIYSQNLSIKLKSLDARMYPDVYPNYYSDSRDYDQMMTAVFAVRNILFGPNTDENMFVDDPFWSNASSIQEWRDLIWKNGISGAHPIGTVAMGSDSVYPVDTKCALKGVHNLRIVDVSIWPESTNSGTMSLAHMIGEKCAKHIIDDHKNDGESWWDKNQIYVIIAIIVVLLVIVSMIFIVYKCYGKNNSRKDKYIETVPLIKSK